MLFEWKKWILISWLVILLVPPLGFESQNEAQCSETQHVQLFLPLKEGVCYRIRCVLRARGHLLVPSVGTSKETRLPLEVHGTLGYHELLLDESPLRSARHYDESQVTIKVGDRTHESALPDDQCWVGCQFVDGRIGWVSAGRPLSGQEHDLIDLQGNSLLLHGLIPDRLTRGQEWPIDKIRAGALVGVDTPIDCSLVGRLASANSLTAVVEISGQVTGGVNGVRTEIDVAGKLTIDMSSRSVRSLDLKIKEKRAIGDGQPGLDVAAHLYLEMSLADIPESLGADRVAVLRDLAAYASADFLRFESELLGVRLLHSKNWKVVLSRYDVAVLRQLDSGELIANMTINSLPNGPPTKQLAMASFQSEIEKSLANVSGQMLEATESKNENGVRVLRVTAAGAIENVSLYWIYYHLSNSSGRRASVVVSVESSKMERFAEAERSLIATWNFIPRADRPAKTAHRDDDDTRE
jgi:hypothetical protein